MKKDWVAKAEEMILKNKDKAKETRKVRKKRLWLERKEGKAPKKVVKNDGKNWGEMPDLCLELIFQYLPFEVSNPNFVFTLWGI